MLVRASNGSGGGGGDLMADSVFSLTLSTSKPFTADKDYKILTVVDHYATNYWTTNIKFNGVNPSASDYTFIRSTGTKAMQSATFYDVKTGDTITCSSGTYDIYIIGYNDAN